MLGGCAGRMLQYWYSQCWTRGNPATFFPTSFLPPSILSSGMTCSLDTAVRPWQIVFQNLFYHVSLILPFQSVCTYCFPCFLYKLELQVVFACVYKFPINIMGTEFSIQRIDRLKEVVRKVLWMVGDGFCCFPGAAIKRAWTVSRRVGVSPKYRWSDALTTPQDCSPQTEMLLFLTKRECQPNDGQFHDIPCLASVLIGHFCSSVHDPAISETTEPYYWQHLQNKYIWQQ